MDAQEKIVKAGNELFIQYGFKTVTLDDISRRAGISKKTLYQFYESKEQIIDTCMRTFHSEVHQSISATLSSSKNAVQAMVEITRFIDSVYRQINPLAMLELQRFFPQTFMAFYNEMMQADAEQVEALLRQGIAEGNFREDINIPLVALYRLESCLLFFQPGTQLTKRFPVHILNQEITELFLYSIMTAKGERLYRKYREAK